MQVDILYILIGLCVGIFLVYITKSAPKIIYKYPTLENINNTTFVDDNNVCYRYYATEIPCPDKLDHKNIEPFMILN